MIPRLRRRLRLRASLLGGSGWADYVLWGSFLVLALDAHPVAGTICAACVVIGAAGYEASLLGRSSGPPPGYRPGGPVRAG